MKMAVVYRPRKARRICFILAGVVLVVFLVLGLVLRGPTDSGKSAFQGSDQVAMMVLGVLVALGILAFARPKVTADAEHVKIQNIIGGYDLPWQVVRAVTFHRGSPWVTLELEDDDVVAVMAIQAADQEYAVEAARSLRELLEASRTPS